MTTYRYFSDYDFKNADPPCNIEAMEEGLLEMLDVARYHAGIPFVINSAFRTVEHEKKQERDGTSSHTLGLAVDVKAIGSRSKYKIIYGLIKAGFTRIGVGDSFVHADSDEDKDQEVIWTY